MIINIFDTKINSVYTNNDFSALAKFISSHRTEIAIQNNVRNLFKQEKLANSTLIRMYNEHLDYIKEKKMIFLLYTLEGLQNIPSLLVIPHFNLDSQDVKKTNSTAGRVFESFPEYNDKILLNMTGLYNSKLEKIVSKDVFIHKVVQSIIFRLYSNMSKINKDTVLWLNSSIIVPLTEIFATLISFNISRLFNLPLINQRTISIILGMYFSQRCSTIDNDFIPIYKQIRRFGTLAEINAVEQNVKETLGRDNINLSLDDIIDLIKKMSPTYMEEYSLDIFLRQGRTYNTNPILGLLSMEYPPAWLYNILTAISGENKSNTYWTLQKTSTLKIAKNLVSNLESSNVLFDIYR